MSRKLVQGLLLFKSRRKSNCVVRVKRYLCKKYKLFCSNKQNSFVTPFVLNGRQQRLRRQDDTNEVSTTVVN